jgi:hypothetical protein
MVRQQAGDHDKAGGEERWQQGKLESSDTVSVKPPRPEMQHDAGRQKQSDKDAGKNGLYRAR